mmetsp:Transcript_30576/g.76495  ORF Transcript_30576/g.76495 Transcript_30576/m.76495 type:complete len:222 (+) Transcript_30576:271-936(+)
MSWAMRNGTGKPCDGSTRRRSIWYGQGVDPSPCRLVLRWLRLISSSSAFLPIPVEPSTITTCNGVLHRLLGRRSSEWMVANSSSRPRTTQSGGDILDGRGREVASSVSGRSAKTGARPAFPLRGMSPTASRLRPKAAHCSFAAWATVSLHRTRSPSLMAAPASLAAVLTTSPRTAYSQRIFGLPITPQKQIPEVTPAVATMSAFRCISSTMRLPAASAGGC